MKAAADLFQGLVPKRTATEIGGAVAALRPHRRLLALVAAAAAILGAVAWFSGWFEPSAPVGVLLVSGDVEAHESVLSFKTVQSRITLLPFDEGATVKAGTLLARVDDADYRQQVAIAETALDVQQRQFAAAQQQVDAAKQTVVNDGDDLAEKRLDASRLQALWGERAISQQARDLAVTAAKQSAAALARDQALERVAERDADLAAANVKSAQASLGMARIVLSYTELRAPFSGVILVRQAELGESVVPGTPVVTMADLDHVWLRAYVNEPDIGKIRYGERVNVTTDSYPGKVYHGRISFISSQAEFTPKSVETHAERITLVYRVRIDLENPTHELVPGMPADADIGLVPRGGS